MLNKSVFLLTSLLMTAMSLFGQVDLSRLQAKADEALAYNKKHGFNTDFCLLVDMKMHSGRERLFLWDFKKGEIVDSGCCSHGCGPNEWSSDETKTSPQFSNTPESHQSSLGKYKIGRRSYSNWGIHVKYTLYGLDASNSNARKRIIVLHSWNMVPENEVYPRGTPEGWGCPAVSNETMKRLDVKLQESEKPVLLWIFQ